MLISYSKGRMSEPEENMSDSNGIHEQNAEITTFDLDKMSDKEKAIFERREAVYKNMCEAPAEQILVKDIANDFNVDVRTINRDKDWCIRHRPNIWASELARHGFLYNTMEYETHMKNSLTWLYRQRDSTDDPMEKLAFQKEISATLNNIVAVGSKHPFYEGIKKIIAEHEEKSE